MKVDLLEKENIFVEYNNEKYKIEKRYISGTLIINYFLYGCYCTNDYENYITEFTSLEEALLYIKEEL